MKRITIQRFAICIFGLLLATTLSVFAAKNTAENVPSFPKTLANAHYVYVTSYDGDQYNKNLLPEDREAIINVQRALQKSGKFAVVYEPRQADMVIVIQSRGDEDVLAVYDGHGWSHNGAYLWRVMAKGGLLRKDTPLMAEFLSAFTTAKAK